MSIKPLENFRLEGTPELHRIPQYPDSGNYEKGKEPAQKIGMNRRRVPLNQFIFGQV
jgi:hypothetical protein